MTPQSMNPSTLLHSCLQIVIAFLFAFNLMLIYYSYIAFDFFHAKVFSYLTIFTLFFFLASFAVYNNRKLVNLTALCVVSQFFIWHLIYEGSSTYILLWGLSLLLIIFFILPVWIAIAAITLLLFDHGHQISYHIDQPWQFTLVFVSIFLMLTWSLKLILTLKQQALIDKAYIDLASGAYNASYLSLQLAQEVSRAHHTQSPLSLMLVGIDDMEHFKENYGKPHFDKLMAEFNSMIKDSIRTGDEVYYIGDAVFAVLMPNTEYKGVNVPKNRIIELAGSNHWPFIDELTVKVASATLTQMESSERFLERVSNQLKRQQNTNLRITAFNNP